jgi:V/A-type H+-transporting ATPase subunit F
LYRLVVVTDPDTADGFRLAGVDVHTAATVDEARAVLRALLDTDSSGIIAVNQSLMPAIDERMQHTLDLAYRPIVVPLPVRAVLAETETHAQYLSRLIRRAVGFDITLRRG